MLLNCHKSKSIAMKVGRYAVRMIQQRSKEARLANGSHESAKIFQASIGRSARRPDELKGIEKSGVPLAN